MRIKSFMLLLSFICIFGSAYSANIVSGSVKQDKISVLETTSLQNQGTLTLAAATGDSGNLSAKDKENRRVVAIAVAGVAVILGVFFALGLYIYVAICLQRIAKKAKTEPTWLAWIPVANAFLMCKIAGLSFWWLLIFFAAGIPFIGMLFVAAFSGYLWYRIALVLNKPGWVGAICAIPLVNLVIMGYLAFSTD